MDYPHVRFDVNAGVFISVDLYWCQGAFDHGAERRGHIPGARHLPREQLLTEEGTFKAPDELWAEFGKVGVSDEHEIVTSCRLSHRASLGWFVLTRLLGRGSVRVYDGSWTEWGSIVGYPVER